jgi:hypothetical protein
MLRPRLRQIATLLMAIIALAGCGGYVLVLDSLLELWRARAAARVGVYEHVGVVASAQRVVYTLLFCAVVLGAVGTALVKLAGVWRDRRPALEQPDGSHSIFGPLLLWPLYATLTLPWLGCEVTGLLNVLVGGSAPTAETWVFEKSIKRAKGRSSELLRRGGEQMEVSYVPVPTRPSAPVTLMRRRGMLGMSYISER